MRRLYCLLLALFPLFINANAEEARLLRFPSVGGDKIAFTYAGDLYTVPVDGGQATKLTSHIGFEMFSRFSPDGNTIAFTGQYDGNTEVYLIPAEGGVPQRLTYTATLDRDDIGDRMGPNNIVMCWTPDGKDVVFRTRWYTFSGLRGLLYHAPTDGSDISQIPTTEGGFCSYSPDGKYLAMNRMFREFRTWKYYRGGQADDIWINKVGTTELENITNNPAQDIFPMWVGEEIYFLSDRDHIMNLFCYDTKSKEVNKITNFDKYDCKFPSYSQDYIVFENGGWIYKYSIAEKKCEKVEIELVSDDIYARNTLVDVNTSGGYGIFRDGITISPDGKRVVSAIRGNLVSVPAEEGAVYHLTTSSESHERIPAWSPNGEKIAYVSDATGEYQIHLMDANDPTKDEVLTSFSTGYPTSIKWMPNSESLLFSTTKNDIYHLNISTKELKKILDGKGRRISSNVSILKDGSWIAYSAETENTMSAIYLYNVAEGKSYPVTSNWYSASSPLFSEDGKYLFFTSSRDYNASYSRLEWNTIYTVNSFVFVVPLAKDTPDPTLISGDEASPVKVKDEVATPPAKSKGGDKSKGKKVEKPAVQPIRIDIDGIAQRASVLPLEAGYYSLITTQGDALLYSSRGGTNKISMKDLKVSPVTKARIITLTPDGKRALINDKGKNYVVNTNNFKSDKAINLDDIKINVDYSKEWKQIFDETWRIFRDEFYLEDMHGKDWNAIHEKYAELLPYVKHRQDLTYIIGEMISELNVGHAYVTTGEAPRAERIKVGLLGGKFSKDKSGYFQIDKIFKGEDWDKTRVSPLGKAGLDVSVGDFIISVDGKSCKDMKNIYEALVGKVGTIVALEVNSKATEEGARKIYVKPIADETQLAYYEWVQTNIKKVEEASNGQIGYIHIPDMSTVGLDEFTKLYYSQLNKKALIIDDRMNGGGNVSPIIMEKLQREAYRMSMHRTTGQITDIIPEGTHHGPKVCLVDKYSSSDGDLFPYGFQKLGLGPIIGTRTWGGIVGITGSKSYVDGQDVRVPFFTSYSTEGEWIVENHGVDPDIVVDINPFEDYLGNDAQLNKAIEYLLEELKSYKPLPGIPAPRVMP